MPNLALWLTLVKKKTIKTYVKIRIKAQIIVMQTYLSFRMYQELWPRTRVILKTRNLLRDRGISQVKKLFQWGFCQLGKRSEMMKVWRVKAYQIIQEWQKWHKRSHLRMKNVLLDVVKILLRGLSKHLGVEKSCSRRSMPHLVEVVDWTNKFSRHLARVITWLIRLQVNWILDSNLNKLSSSQKEC